MPPITLSLAHPITYPITQAVILAGGLGTRLGTKYKSIPKPMIRIGGIPNLEYQLLLVKTCGFDQAVLLTSYHDDYIKKYFYNGQDLGIKISYCDDKNPSLGTAGALQNARELLAPQFLLLYGDIFIRCDFGPLCEDHLHNWGIATIVVHPNDHPEDSDLVEIAEGGRVSKIHPKSKSRDVDLPNVVNAGVGIFDRTILDYIPAGVHCDLARDIFPKLIAARKLRAFYSSEYFKDFGTPERLQQVRNDYHANPI